MKKNILRTLSLVLVAAMLFACTSCTQTILVRFVDKNGDDIQIGSIIPANNSGTSTDTTPASQTPASETPASQTPASETPASDTPASQTPASQTPASQTPASETPASQTPASETPASQTPASETPANAMPTGTQAIADFYKKAVNKVKDGNAASYTKKEYQTISNLNVTGIGAVDSAIMNVAKGYFKDESTADLQVSTKGDENSGSRMNGFTLTDYSKIKSATCTANGSNYDITIVMQDEDTPHKGQSFLQQVGSVLVWEDIEEELKNVSILSGYDNVHILYKDYTIKATITPDGNFTALTHHADITIQIGMAKILFATLKDKSVDMSNDIKFDQFQY